MPLRLRKVGVLVAITKAQVKQVLTDIYHYDDDELGFYLDPNSNKWEKPSEEDTKFEAAIQELVKDFGLTADKGIESAVKHLENLLFQNRFIKADDAVQVPGKATTISSDPYKSDV